MSLIRVLLIVPMLLFAAPPAQAYFERAELEQMLAPIALYPDSVLSHVLIAATYPDQVAEAARWSDRHPDLQGEAAVDAVEKYDWDPSVKALVAFPEVLARMDEDPDWTDQLGEAFLDQEGEVMDAVQHLRTRAYEAGRLDSLDNVRVVREREYIYIEPAVHGVIFVPYYDPWWVYGSWWWPHYPPYMWTTWYGRPVSYYGSRWYWGIGFHVRPAFYFTTFHWPARHVVVTHHYDRPLYSGRDAPRHREVRHWRQEPSARRHADRKPRAERRDPGADRREDRRPDRGVERRPDRRDAQRDERYRDRRGEAGKDERKDERKNEREDRAGKSAAPLNPERREATRSESRRERMERGRQQRDAQRGRAESNGAQVRGSPGRRDRSEPPAQIRREAPAEQPRAARPKPQAERREEAGTRGQGPQGRREEASGRREEAQGHREEAQGRREQDAPRGQREEAQPQRQPQRDRAEDRGQRGGSGERAQGRQKDKGERGRSQRGERSR